MSRRLILLASLLLAVAVFNMPYGYYSFLRIAISVICIYLIIQEIENMTWAFFFYCACLILHNPILKVHFKREEWFYIDLFCAGVFLLLTFVKPPKISD